MRSMTNEQPAIKPALPGWVMRSHPNTFSAHAGPFYFREGGSTPGVGFFSELHHANLGNVVHGGALMTLADMALFDIWFRAEGRTFKAVTVTMNTEFLNPAPIGEFIEASGEMVKTGKRLSFVRGLVVARGKSVLAFSGTLMRVS